MLRSICAILAMAFLSLPVMADSNPALQFTVKGKTGTSYRIVAYPPECVKAAKKQGLFTCQETGNLPVAPLGKHELGPDGTVSVEMPAPGYGIVCAIEQTDDYPKKCAKPGKSVAF